MLSTYRLLRFNWVILCLFFYYIELRQSSWMILTLVITCLFWAVLPITIVPSWSIPELFSWARKRFICNKKKTMLRIRDIYPGSRDAKIPVPDPHQRIKVFLTQKTYAKFSLTDIAGPAINCSTVSVGSVINCSAASVRNIYGYGTLHS